MRRRRPTGSYPLKFDRHPDHRGWVEVDAAGLVTCIVIGVTHRSEPLYVVDIEYPLDEEPCRD